MTDLDFTLTIALDSEYTQRVSFGASGIPDFIVDEPPPLGAGTGPNPVRIVGSAVGACLSASLLFCLRKARVDVFDMQTTVRGSLVRNERGRLRIGGMEVRLEPTVPDEQIDRVKRCLPVFEDYCVVTATLRAAFPITVEVSPRTPALTPAGV